MIDKKNFFEESIYIFIDGEYMFSKKKKKQFSKKNRRRVYIFNKKKKKSNLKIKKKMLTCKIVELAKASVIYIYIYI